MKDRREPSVVANVKSAQVRQLRPVGDPAGLRVHLLGPMTVTLDGRSVAIAARKARALLGYLALREGSEHKVSLDQVIETMYQTGMDMQSRYKETSLGGLALNVIEC